MQNLAFTHLNLFDGKIDSDLQEDIPILVAIEANKANRYFEKYIKNGLTP